MFVVVVVDDGVTVVSVVVVGTGSSLSLKTLMSEQHRRHRR